MAYIPPHKRPLSEDTNRPLPTAYPEPDVYRWLITDLNEDNQFPSSVHLEKLISLEEWKEGDENLVLVNSCLNEETNQVRENILRSPWVSIAENVEQDLISSFEDVRKDMMECQELEKVKPTLVARFGKIIFHRRPSPILESVKKSQVSETTLRHLNTFFYTNIPTTYVENIIGGVAPIIGVDFEEKERYRVWLHDTILDASVMCKCSVEHDKKLEPYKVELGHSRYMVVNISCLDKDLDLRLMLLTKKILTAMTDDEKNCIRDLVRSADLDSSVKGGLKWTLGKDTGGRFSIVKFEHLIVKSYSSPSLRLKLIHADRGRFGCSSGEDSWEVNLKLKKLLSELQERVEINSISDTLKDNLRLIWDHFLSCESYLI